MIVQSKNRDPYVHLGFNRQTITVGVDDEVTIWQNNLYNYDVYDVEVGSADAFIVSANINKIVVTFDTIGTYNLDIRIENKEKIFFMDSNQLEITVILFYSFRFYLSRNTQYLQFIT